MDLEDFVKLHVPALEADEVRFNLQIAAITAAALETPPGFRHWTLGAAGHCAAQWPGLAIVLGDLDRDECGALARAAHGLDYPGVVGADDTSHWFVEHATALGARFDDVIPQRIHVLAGPPRYPDIPGAARAATVDDLPLVLAWMEGFRRDAVPHDPLPPRATVEKAIANGRFLFWTIDQTPVSVAAIARRLRHTGAISQVYTPPHLRGRGYAGGATAAAVDRLLQEGRTSACLYTDLRNPFSNRCYARIGFVPHCDSRHYVRSG